MIDWIEAHIKDNPDKLRLRYHGHPEYTDAITQIDCRQRTASKLPAFVAHREFRFPSTLSAEQATSEQLALYHSTLVPEGVDVLDLTCGLGIDAFTLATKARSVTALEIDADRAECARHNSRVLGLENVEIITADANDYIPRCSRQFDAIFLDPARRAEGGRRTFALADCSPDAAALMPRLLELAPLVIVKASPMLDITHTVRLKGFSGHISDIQAIGTIKECRELIIIARRETSDKVRVTAVTSLGKDSVVYTSAEMEGASVSYALPGKYIYEPWPAVMKTTPWAGLCRDFKVSKISAATNLFTSDEFIAGFPGTIYETVSVSGFSKRDISTIAKTHIHLNIAARGIGISADELRKRLKITDGGELKLFGVTLCDNHKSLIISKPINR